MNESLDVAPADSLGAAPLVRRADEPASGKVTRGFLALGAGELLARVAAFGAAVYASRVLGATQYGVVSFAAAVMLYLQRVGSWELEGVVLTEVASDGERARRTISSLLIGRLLVALVLIALVWGVGVTLLPQPDGTVLGVYSFALIAIALNTRWVYLMRHQSLRPAVARIAAEVAAAAFVIALLEGPSDVIRVPGAMVTGEAFGAALLIAGLSRTLAWQVDWELVRSVARRSLPLVLSALLGLVVFNIDLVMLRFTRGPRDAGYYAAAYALIGLVVNLGMAYYANVLPAFAKLRESREAGQALYDSSSALVLAAVLPVVVGGALVAPQLVHTVFGAEYGPSAAPLRLLFASAGLNVARFVPLAALVASGARSRVLFISAVGAALNVALNLVLIPRFGMLGAATSTVVTDLLRLVINLSFVGAAGLGALRLSGIWRPLVAAIAMGAAVWLIHDRELWVTVPVGAAVYAIALAAAGGLKVKRGEGLVLRT